MSRVDSEQEGTYAVRDRRALEAGYVVFFGNACPREYLTAEPCLNGTDDGPCWCTSSLNDHGFVARDSDDEYRGLVMWEPYDFDPEVLAEITTLARADGLKVHVSGRGFWHSMCARLIFTEVVTARRTHE